MRNPNYPRIPEEPLLEIANSPLAKDAYKILYAALKGGEGIEDVKPAALLGAGLMLVAIAAQCSAKCLTATTDAVETGLPLAWETVEVILEHKRANQKVN